MLPTTGIASAFPKLPQKGLAATLSDMIQFATCIFTPCNLKNNKMKSLIFSIAMILLTSSINAQWSLIPSSSISNELLSVCFTDSITGYTGGIDGVIYKTNDGGVNWIPQKGTNRNITSICFPTYNIGFAVDNFGYLYKTTDGNYWSDPIRISTSGLTSMFFLNVNIGYAVGTAGTIIKTNDGGETWTIQSSGIPINFRSVHFPSINTGYAVGDYGALYKTNNAGNNWIDQSIDANSLFSVYFLNDSVGFTAGSGGKIFKTINGGTDWSLQPSETSSSLKSIYFTDSQIGYIVGGVILQTNDGGNSWVVQPKPSSAGLYDVSFPDKNTGYAVGGVNSQFSNYSIVVKLKNKSNGIGNEEKFSEINIYPNPTKNNFILATNGFDEKQEITIYNVIGDQVYKDNIFNTSKREINLINILSGVYFVRVSDGSKQSMRKLIVQ
jgi:photosystem II stability/assembly factor-like uncharacterized protein